MRQIQHTLTKGGRKRGPVHTRQDKLAEDCEYGGLKDQLIRDRIVVGVPDDDLSNDLQAKPDLTLAEAMQLSRQAEARGQPLLCNTASVEWVWPKKGQNQGHHHQPPHYKTPKPQNRPHHKQGSCQYCRQVPHMRDKCPARQATCAHCSKSSHYKAVCRSWLQHVNKLLEEDSNSEDEWPVNLLGEVYAVHSSTEAWTVEICVTANPSTSNWALMPQCL